MPTILRPLYDVLHALPGNVKLSIALAAPVVAVAILDWWTRRSLRVGR